MKDVFWHEVNCPTSPAKHTHLNVFEKSFCFFNIHSSNMCRHVFVLMTLLCIITEGERKQLLESSTYKNMPEMAREPSTEEVMGFAIKFVRDFYHEVHADFAELIQSSILFVPAVPLDHNGEERGGILFDRLGKPIWIDSMQNLNVCLKPEDEPASTGEDKRADMRDEDACIARATEFGLPQEPPPQPADWTVRPYFLLPDEEVEAKKIPFILAKIPDLIPLVGFSRKAILDVLDNLSLPVLCDEKFEGFRKTIGDEKHVDFPDEISIRIGAVMRGYDGYAQLSDGEVLRTEIVTKLKEVVVDHYHRSDDTVTSSQVLDVFAKYLEKTKKATAVSDARPVPVSLPQHEPVGATDVSESGQSPRKKGRNGQRVPLN